MDASSFRIVMVGTKDFALPTLQALLQDGFNVVALITQPERPQGRTQERIVSKIKQYALDRGVAVQQPDNINSPESLDAVRSFAPDLLVTAAYGQILSSALLAIPRFGGINLHGSILPAYRGAAPVARAIEHGETETGITVIQMAPRVDAGGILAVEKTPIGPDETAGQLEARLACLGAPVVTAILPRVFAGEAVAWPQDRTKVSRAPKLQKDDGRIDWNQSAPRIHNLVRAMQPWPTAHTTWRGPDAAGELRLLVHRTQVVDATGPPGAVIESAAAELVVAAGEGAVRLLEVQVPGKRAMPAADFLRGRALKPGGRFVSST